MLRAHKVCELRMGIDSIVTGLKCHGQLIWHAWKFFRKQGMLLSYFHKACVTHSLWSAGSFCFWGTFYHLLCSLWDLLFLWQQPVRLWVANSQSRSLPDIFSIVLLFECFHSLQEFSSESDTRFAWKHLFLRCISNPSLLFLCSHTKSLSMHTTGLEKAMKSQLTGSWWHWYIDNLLSHEFGGRLYPSLRLGEDVRGTDRAVALWIWSSISYQKAF